MSSEPVTTVAAERRGFVHQALVYGTDEEFLAAAVPFVRAGLQHGEAVVAVTAQANIGLLREALGVDAAHTEFIDSLEWYLHPGRTLAAYYEYITARQTRVRAIGEVVWSGPNAAHASEWKRYESALNPAFARLGAWVVCPYDRRVLDADIVTGALRTHPEVVVGGDWRHNSGYVEPAAFAAECDRQPLPPPPEVTALPFSSGGDLRRLRLFVTAHADRAGLSRERTTELVMGVNEVATNAIRHGGGRGDLRLWVATGALVCEVSDPGLWPDPAFAGYLPPARTAQSGGLWLARQLCDQLDVRSGPAGTTVRIQVTLPAPP